MWYVNVQVWSLCKSIQSKIATSHFQLKSFCAVKSTTWDSGSESLSDHKEKTTANSTLFPCEWFAEKFAVAYSNLKIHCMVRISHSCMFGCVKMGQINFHTCEITKVSPITNSFHFELCAGLLSWRYFLALLTWRFIFFCIVERLSVSSQHNAHVRMAWSQVAWKQFFFLFGYQFAKSSSRTQWFADVFHLNTKFGSSRMFHIRVCSFWAIIYIQNELKTLLSSAKRDDVERFQFYVERSYIHYKNGARLDVTCDLHKLILKYFSPEILVNRTYKRSWNETGVVMEEHGFNDVREH